MSQAGLADRAPAGGAAAQGFADKGRAAVFPRTEAAILPSVWHEPGGRRIGPIHGDGLHGFLADGAEHLAESRRIDRAGGRGGIQVQLIADFVRHPVADAGEPGLIMQEGLQRAAGVALQGAGDAGGGELGTEDFRGQGLPGGRRGGRGFIQADATEHAEVAEYEGGRFYLQQDLHHRLYINTEAGKVLVFPSHVMHGVEPLELGVRHSVVAWISGPDFK